VFFKPSAEFRDVRRLAQLQDKTGLLLPSSFIARELCSAADRAEAEDQRGVRVPDVLARAVVVMRRVMLDKLVAIGDPAVFRQPALGAPAAVRDS
jgi:hypothetical protein